MGENPEAIGRRIAQVVMYAFAREGGAQAISHWMKEQKG